MADSKDYHELLISESLIPDIFIVRYMPMLSKDATDLYLWATMNYKGRKFKLKDALSYTIIPEEDINNALKELVANGLLTRSDNDEFEFTDIKKIEIDEYINSKVDGDGVLVLKSDEKKRKKLAESIQKTYYNGYMAYAFYKLIDKCLHEYHFEDAVVYALFEEGKKQRVHFKVPMMYELAQEWYEKGYLTADSLKEYYERQGNNDELVKLMGKLLRRRLNDNDLTRIGKWTELYKADPELVQYAFKCNEYRGNIRTVDVENKLRDWFDAGVTSIDKACIYEKEREEENTARASRARGRTNVRKTGKDAGITVETNKDRKDVKSAPENDPVADNDPILAMFGGENDEDDI